MIKSEKKMFILVAAVVDRLILSFSKAIRENL